MSSVRDAVGLLVGLVVDDGFLAVGSLLVIGAVGVAADRRLTGAGNGTGWLLVILLAGVTATSVLRAVLSHRQTG